ncbi:MAG: hypothetical protein ACLGHY_10025 [Gammaproteobacteria bacterium]
MASSTADRVARNTPEEINQRIRNATEMNVVWAAQEGPAGIDRRLRELDQEWDIERCLETGAASLTVLGVAMGTNGDRKWLLLPAVVGGFLLLHVVQGWCPPLPVLRRLGVRTAGEINEERTALKALRGDFSGITLGAGADSIRQALAAARR